MSLKSERGWLWAAAIAGAVVLWAGSRKGQLESVDQMYQRRMRQLGAKYGDVFGPRWTDSKAGEYEITLYQSTLSQYQDGGGELMAPSFVVVYAYRHGGQTGDGAEEFADLELAELRYMEILGGIEDAQSHPLPPPPPMEPNQ